MSHPRIQFPVLAVLLLVAAASGPRPSAAAVIRTTPGPIDRKLINDPDFCPSDPVLTTFEVDHPEVTIEFRVRNLGTPLPPQSASPVAAAPEPLRRTDGGAAAIGAPAGPETPRAASGGSLWMFHAIDNISILARALHDQAFEFDPPCFDCDEPGFVRWDLLDPQDFEYLATFTNGVPPEWFAGDGAYWNLANDPMERTATNDLSDSLECFGERSGGSMGLGPDQGDEFASTWATIDGLVPGEEYVLSYWWNARPDSAPDNGDLWVTVYGYEPWRDVTPPALTGAVSTWSAAWGDYDGDDDPDLYVARAIGSSPKNRLLRNDAGSLVDATPPELQDAGDASSATWVDADGDGDQDLFLANWDGSGNRLWRNDGGDFEDVATGALTPAPSPLAVAWADYDLDGDVDLFLGHFGAPNALFRNDGDFSFVDVATAPLTGGAATQGAAWADYDLDGDPDLYVAAAGAPNALYRNDAGSFVDVAAGALSNLADTGQGRGVAWGDHDNDGDPDLFVANDAGENRLFENVGAGASFVNAETGGVKDAERGYGCAWEDTDLDGDLDLFFARGDESNSLFRNDGASGWTESVGGPFPLTAVRNTIGGAFADVDGDGDADLALANLLGDGDSLFRNDVEAAHHWLAVDLEGTVSNRDGIGARVVLEAGGVTRTREVSSGSSYYEQRDRTQRFGLGDATTITSLTVHWPSGVVQAVPPPAVDQRVVVVETDPTGVGESRPASPEPRLHPVAPNPFGSSTEVRFELPRPGRVRLRVYDVVGRRVRTLLDGPREA
ncbi:MAG TPA: CRTAC1 family protein, partial [bacterium]|nr:CRTAC1 family protein [bacterium]